MRPVLAVLLAAALAALPATADARRPCTAQRGFSCGTLVVPLDRAAPDGVKVHLRYAVQAGKAAARRPLLVALSGGPGQPAVGFATSFADSLAPALSRYRLAVLDQRGTGGSGVLSCPTLQRLGSLHSATSDEIAACAELLGPRRAFYATRDTVEDIDALRAALGAGQIALMGVSYGTFVAQQYARVHPDRTRALILDSVLGPDGVDGFLLDSYAATPRVLREQCARRRCAGVTSDPVGEAGAIAARAEATGGLTGRVIDARGRVRRTAYTGADEIVNLLVAGDLNPFLQAALPGAIASAVRGDTAPLMRLRAIGDGASSPASQFSYALNVATTCADGALPYTLSTPFAVRDQSLAAALDGIDPATYAPFDAATVLRTSLADECKRWPQDAVQPPSAEPLPDVPALLLTGRLDLRTPMENAVGLADEMPRAAVVRVGGTGHDELDSDITGCTQVALSRFVRGRTVGAPCRGQTNQVLVFPRAPRTLADFRRASGVPGDRGRAVSAVLDTVLDARVTLLQRYYADLSLRGGGLRGGTFTSTSTLSRLRLRNYGYLPGLRVTGRLRLGSGTVSGRLRVDGPRGTSGAVRLYADGRVRGRLGGRRVSHGGRGGARASAARRADGAPSLLSLARRLPSGRPPRPWR